MKKLIVDSRTGIVLSDSHAPYPDGTEIDKKVNPYPKGNPGSMTHKWDFTTSAWVVDSVREDKKAAYKQKIDDHVQAKKDEHARVKAAVNNVATNWIDPNGTLLKALYEGFEAMYRKDA